MSWQTISPIQKTSGTPMVSASLAKNKHGQITLKLFLSAFVSDKLGTPETVIIQSGEGEHAGCVRIEPILAEGGGMPEQPSVFKLTSVMRGSKRVQIPAFAGLPIDAASNLPCSILTETKDELIVRLPVAEWEIEISRRNTVPVKQPSPIIVPKTVAPVSDKLDMLGYLRGKGAKVSKLAGDLWSYEGERVVAADILKIINQHRKKASLPPLTAEQVQ